MTMKEAAQWRIRVIAAWPMAPEGDDQGLRAHEIAQKSMLHPSTVTAFLDPTIEHSYLSRDLAQYMMGVYGLELADSASRKQLLGQVAVILCCDGSEHNQTETFLLCDLGTIDMVLSPRSWRSLEKQCDELTRSNKLLTGDSHTFISGSSQALQCADVPRQYIPEKMCFPTHDFLLKSILPEDTEKSVSSETTRSVSDAGPSDRWIHTPYSTPEKMLSPAPSHTELCDGILSMTQGDTFAGLSARHYHVPDCSPVEHDEFPDGHAPWHNQECAPGSDHVKEWEANGDYFHDVWSWDTEKQNYFCRDRDKNDEWYWYPTDII